jgi:acetyl-CoA carboxylase biotin carboxyl carrier protein
MSRILFDPETIQRLAAILKDAGLSELEMHEGEARLKLVRAAPALPAALAPSPVVVNTGTARPVEAVASSAEPPPPPGAVKSPMVGIAYLAPEPASPPYITLGATVTLGQTVMLIEAMKTFNQIKAPRAGTVTQILIESGAPVEYDQPLLVIA